jgi:hypothetical protein
VAKRIKCIKRRKRRSSAAAGDKRDWVKRIRVNYCVYE